jgi:hypothetical protein
MKQPKDRLIGIWGYPNPQIINEIKDIYPKNTFIDLDINYNNPSSGLLPDAFCRIMKNIADNSIALKDRLDLIIASTGREKCDSGWFLSKILKEIGFNIIETKYEELNNESNGTPISKSNMPLRKKIIAIMANIIKKQELNYQEALPDYGFWGVPPNNFEFLDIFPDNTHLYGWTRCVEAKRPADIDLEMYVDENVPTVFYAQTFCAKMGLAKYLAKKHSGLYVDVDDRASNSVRAKIEAFIKLG